MIANWKQSLAKETNQRLFEIFSERDRINIEPQIFAGNLLFGRGFDVEKLKQAKGDLISAMEKNFSNKLILDPKKNKKENLIREVAIRSTLALGVVFFFIVIPRFEFFDFDWSLGSYLIVIALLAINFLPLLWIEKSHRKSLEKAERENVRKNILIAKINDQLKF